MESVCFPLQARGSALRARLGSSYMPRLDWQMWFAALGSVEQNPWFLNFLERLLDGSPSVPGLLDENPFPHGRPRLVRAGDLSDRSRLTTMSERARAGNWWNVEPTPRFIAREFRLKPGSASCDAPQIKDSSTRPPEKIKTVMPVIEIRSPVPRGTPQ